MVRLPDALQPSVQPFCRFFNAFGDIIPHLEKSPNTYYKWWGIPFSQFTGQPYIICKEFCGHR